MDDDFQCNTLQVNQGTVNLGGGSTLRSAYASITTSGSTVIPASTTTVPAGLAVSLNQALNVSVVTADGFSVAYSGRYLVNVRAQLIQATSQPISVQLLVRPSGGASIGNFIYKFAPGTQTHAIYPQPFALTAGVKYEVAVQNVSGTDSVTVEDLDIHVDYA